MGSRGRSIRLRIYILVAIPLITMLGLFGYVAYTSVNNWLNLDRAPSLIQATSEPLTNFVNVLQAERRAAMVYLSQPNAANLTAYQAAVKATRSHAAQLAVALDSPGTKNSSTPAEDAAIAAMTAQLNNMAPLRASVSQKKLTPIAALSKYTNIIAGQGAVLQAEAQSITDAAPVIQGLGLISAVNTQEDVSEQDAVLASALASGSLTGPDRVAFSNAVGRLQNDTLSYQQLLTPAELKTYNATLNGLAPQSVQANLAKIQQAVPAGISLSTMKQQGLSPASWQLLTQTWLKAASKAGTTTATTVLAANQQPAIDAKRRVVVLSAVGAAGLILTLIVSLLLSRSINRRLNTLRRSALTLAEEQLPSVVARLRRGESVDVAAEAPPLRVGSDEIGQVGQAIDTVRQTAIRSAIDEARVRQGVNDMFRNLARRNQSLLQRQLTVLDEMERRATDPDVLDDLFKMDHLTTRMRRHAEGLIILSGSPPGRSWSAPVKLIDVMRGAVAEVEDYARVTVSSQSRAALAGSAVTDLIHLLAELIENATSLSPPFTQVKVSGETVANGFAIEIEDRGLGMGPERLHELNERLANPPDINPANTEQLGLFVVGQLARRHGVRVMLRPSPYGGTTAVVLIPLPLIVEDGPAAITSGGRVPPASTAAQWPQPGTAATAGPGSRDAAGAAQGTGFYQGSWPSQGSAPSQGTTSPGQGPGRRPTADGPAWDRGPAGGGTPAYRPAAAARGGDRPVPSRSGYPEPGTPDQRNVAATAGGYETGGYPSGGHYPGAPGSGTSDAGAPDGQGSTIRISDALRHPDEAGGSGGYPASPGAGRATGAAAPGASRGRHGTEDVHVVTGVPVPASAAPRPEPEPEFDVFTPIRRGPAAESAGASDNAAFAADAYPQAYPDFGARAADGYPGTHGAADPAAAGEPGSGYPAAGTPADDGNGGGDSDTELPRRVRQASLAPQLRAGAGGSTGPAQVPPANAASLAVMRNTLSAMQRGWQQGRSQAQGDAEE